MKNMISVTEILRRDINAKLLLGGMVADGLLLIALIIITGALLVL